MRKHVNSIIFGIAMVLSAIFLAKGYVDRKKTQGKIQVTGLGEMDFTSNLIVWEGRFVAENKDLKMAYTMLKQNRSLIKNYLDKKGIASDKIVFSAVSTVAKSKRKYTAKGDYIGDEFSGYELSQSVKIESNEVNKIEKISREVTELLNQGISFYSNAPRYYYTKLSDLKIKMISEATKDARTRAEKIAKFSEGKLGDLESARMGVFQITGQNSGENYSWGGTFNTSAKKKTASITMKLTYKLR